MSKTTYMLKEIKAAFWNEFHESGELWFDYSRPSEENKAITMNAWKSFKTALSNAHRRTIRGNQQ